ncbi:MAG: hypothetical protein ABT940_06885, partial [Alphaproteobacteria bacterium]
MNMIRIVTLLACVGLSVALSAGTVVAAEEAPTAATANTFRFNRLMKTGADANAPASQDGIHDPTNPGTDSLQPPREAFADLPKSNS